MEGGDADAFIDVWRCILMHGCADVLMRSLMCGDELMHGCADGGDALMHGCAGDAFIDAGARGGPRSGNLDVRWAEHTSAFAQERFEERFEGWRRQRRRRADSDHRELDIE